MRVFLKHNVQGKSRVTPIFVHSLFQQENNNGALSEQCLSALRVSTCHRSWSWHGSRTYTWNMSILHHWLAMAALWSFAVVMQAMSRWCETGDTLWCHWHGTRRWWCHALPPACAPLISARTYAAVLMEQ